MIDTENTDGNTEVVAPAVEETPQVNEADQEQVPHQSGQTDKEMNFAAMRQKTDDLERKVQEYEQVINSIQGQMQAQSQQEQKAQQLREEIDELEQIANDEWLTKEQSMKLADKRAKLAVEQALEAERTRRAQEELPNRVKQEMPDFDQVVSKENVEYLKAHKPHLAQVLATTQDPYAQAKAAYDAVKAFCPSAQVTQDKQRAERNAQKPGSLDQAGPPRTGETDPYRMSSTTKAQLWKEMQDAARGY